MRYEIKKNIYGVVVVTDTKTGESRKPSCGIDLLDFHNYLVGRGRIDEAQHKLADSMKGEKPITKLHKNIGHVSSHINARESR